MILKYFIKRRTRRDNYRIQKFKLMNGQRIYHVQFKEWLLGWTTFQRRYDPVTDVEMVFGIKEDAKLFIEKEINIAYIKLRG